MLIISEEKQRNFEDMWRQSGVEDRFVGWMNDQLNRLVEELSYIPSQGEYIHQWAEDAGIEQLAYSATEILAQLCAGGMNWVLTDKARFLSPTVDFESMLKGRLPDSHGLGYWVPIHRISSALQGSWDFLRVAENTRTWFEALNLSQDEFEYLLWCSHRAMILLGADERIPGFTYLALTEESVLAGFCKCESPIESILYMRLVVDGLRPPLLQTQLNVDKYRLDFALPDGKIAIECDGKKYHNKADDIKRDKHLSDQGWFILRFSAEQIFQSPEKCSNDIHKHYPWTHFTGASELRINKIVELLGVADDPSKLSEENVTIDKFTELVNVANTHNRLGDLRKIVERELRKKLIQLGGFEITLEEDPTDKKTLSKVEDIRRAVSQLQEQLTVISSHT